MTGDNMDEDPDAPFWVDVVTGIGIVALICLVIWAISL
jgi:hypothetical protein